MTPEGRIKHEIDKMIVKLKAEDVPLYTHKPVQNGMGAPTLDYVGCCRGEYFVIEAKAPGKVPTKIQDDTMKKILAAGGTTHVIDSMVGVLQFAEWARARPH